MSLREHQLQPERWFIQSQSYALSDNYLCFVIVLELLGCLLRPIKILYIVNGYITAFSSEFLGHECTKSSGNSESCGQSWVNAQLGQMLAHLEPPVTKTFLPVRL